MKIPEVEILLLQLFLALITGLVLGLEREGKHKSLGLKTCIVISITSCLLTVVSINFSVDYYNTLNISGGDPLRLASQIVSGVGFLGAGVIFRRDNDVISGLTTAAIVWTAAGFGIMIGAGYYLEVALGLGFIHFTVSYLPKIMRKIGPDSLKEQEIFLKIDINSTTSIDSVLNKMKPFVISFENIKVKGNENGQEIELLCFIKDEKGSIYTQYENIRKISGVAQLEIIKV